MTVMLSVVAGPSAVTTFATLRTLGNVAFQSFNLVTTAVWNEMSTLIGAGKYDIAREVVRRVANLGFWTASMACLALAVCGSWIITVWTHGKVTMYYPLFLCQLLSILIAVIWRACTIVLLATNNHQRYARWNVGAAVLQLVFIVVLYRWLGLAAVGLAMILFEALMIWITMGQSLDLVREKRSSYIRAIFRWPRPGMLRGAA
jgi:O-antigen/teichoic acid export membrane protein